MGKVTNTKGSFQKKLAEMKKKIKQTNHDANARDTGTCFIIIFLKLMSLKINQ